MIVFPLLKFGYFVSFKNLDRGFIELIGPVGVSFLIRRMVKIVLRLQTGQITHYILLLTFMLFFLFFTLVLNNFIGIDLFFIFFILIFYLV